MPDTTPPPAASATASSFEQRASAPRRAALAQIWDYLAAHRKWWLLPPIGVRLDVAGLLVAGSTGAGPLIYTLF